MNNMFELINVSKQFSMGGKKQFALKDFSLSIYKGETLGVLGESGCGKSTLAKILMGVYKPSEGEVLFFGEKLRLNNQRERKNFARHSQMIFQDPYMSLNPHMTVKSILMENMEIHNEPIVSERESRVYELLELVGLSREHINRFPHEFSGGQRQRISIARAISINPDFILCDEPVSALDSPMQRQIMELLSRLKRDMGLTCLFISHDVNILKSFSDRIAVMYAGRLMELGRAEEICENPTHPYTEMLLSSVLSVVPNKDGLKLNDSVIGEAVGLSSLGEGCPFQNRCKYKESICEKEMPRVKSINTGHLISCHRLLKNSV